MTNRTTVLQIRLTDAEKRLIQESAKRAGLPMSAWLRLVILNANLTTLTPPQWEYDAETRTISREAGHKPSTKQHTRKRKTRKQA